jgi:IMP cyclohydrolase
VINPNGPYPGRQLFLGVTAKNRPCLAYLITGRSPESRERKAVPVENTIRIGPVGNAPYDSLRHYSAVKFDDATGVLAVTNGIQTEALFEVYKLLVNVGSPRDKDYFEKIMEGANAEPDSYHTPRIAGVIVPEENSSGFKYIIGMKAFEKPAKAHDIKPQPRTMIGISTYKGDMEKPEARDPDNPLQELAVQADSAAELAGLIFEISAASYKGNDIRVCSLGGILLENGRWDIAIKAD